MCTFVLSDNRGMSEDMGSLHYLPSWYLAILFETRPANYTPKMNAVVAQGRFILLRYVVSDERRSLGWEACPIVYTEML